MDVPILNTQYYDTEKYEPIGYVFGLSIHAISALRDIVSNIMGTFGGKASAINNKTRVVYKDAIIDLRKNAGVCDLIVGLTININEIDQKFIVVDATGTALRLKQKNVVPVQQNIIVGGKKVKSKKKIKSKKEVISTNTKKIK